MCISLMMNDAGHLFKSLLVMCISSLEPCVIKSFTHQHVLLLKSEEKKKGFKHPSGLSQWDFRHRGCTEPSAIALRLLKALAWALQAAHIRGSGVQGCCCRDRRNGALLTYGPFCHLIHKMGNVHVYISTRCLRFTRQRDVLGM